MGILITHKSYERVPLRNLIEITSGQAPPSSTYNNEGTGLPFLRVNSFRDKYPTTKTYTTSPLKTCKKGDILLSVAGTIGELNIADKDYAITRSIFALRPKNEELSMKYLFFYLRQLKKNMEHLSSGSAQKILTREVIFNLEIPLPPIQIQNKIVYILDKAELRVMKSEKLNLLSKKFLKSKFFKLFGDPLLNEKNWQVKKLGDIANINMGGTPSTKKSEYWDNGTINWMKSGDIKKDLIVHIPNKIADLGLKNSNAKICKIGDVVIALNGQGKTRGTTAILGVETTTNQSVANITPKDNITSEYLNYNLKFRYKQIRSLTGDKERSGLNLTILRNFEIMLPPIELQKIFSRVVRKVWLLADHSEKLNYESLKLFNFINKKLFG